MSIERIQQACTTPFSVEEAADGPVLVVEREDAHALLAELQSAAGFEANTFVTAIDRNEKSPRFEVHWGLLSVQHSERTRVMTRVPEDDPRVDSVVDLWPGSSFGERECFDMFGITFESNPDMRRLLMPEEYDHFPLRKDFPHRGIEPDRLYREWERERQARLSTAAEEGGAR